MPSFTLRINCDNEAFTDPAFSNGSIELELARILRELAGRIMRHGIDEAPFTLRDINGNYVGSLTRDPEPEEA